jgi:ABC-type amino acid transport substrate-binding protein
MSKDQKRGLSLSSQISISLAAGILFGIFFGEMAGFLSVVADGYIKLLQMTVLPYVYLNQAGELVGLDVEMAHILAEELDVTLEFVPADRLQLWTQLESAYCDVVMSGFAITTPRAATMAFSAPYLHETVAFVVLDHRRSDFATRESILAQTGLRVGIPARAAFQSLAETFLPDTTQIVPMEDISSHFEEWMAEIDALLLSAERGSFWTLLHPAYSVVVPRPNLVEVPVAYPVAEAIRSSPGS